MSEKAMWLLSGVTILSGAALLADFLALRPMMAARIPRYRVVAEELHVRGEPRAGSSAIVITSRGAEFRLTRVTSGDSFVRVRVDAYGGWITREELERCAERMPSAPDSR